MNRDNYIDKSIDAISSISDSVTSKYNKHIKKKAIKIVDEKIEVLELNIEDIEPEDYEAMVSEAMSKIKEQYSSNTSKTLLGLFGLDLLLG